MTKKEAIENLKGCVCGYEVGKDGKPNGNVTADLTQETIDMAIKALEAPLNDNWEGYSKRLWKSAYERGKTDAEQRWIPVTERLPEAEEIVLITIDSSYYPKSYVDMGFYKAETKKWYWFSSEAIDHSIKVTAWMPLPEPYKAESEDDEDIPMEYFESGGI